MAHRIDFSNGRANMSYVGELPWHELGNELQAGASLETWARSAGFEWSALTAPVQYLDHVGRMQTMQSKRVVYRSDTGAPLATVGDSYKLVQPIEILDFFRSMIDAGSWELTTAGMLDGGRRMWAMASPKGDASADVVPGDRVKPNVMLATSVDGTLRTHAAFTVVRVVCANTVRAALDDNKANNRGSVSVSHRSIFDASAVKLDLGLAIDSFGSFMERARTLANIDVTPAQARELLQMLIAGKTVKPADAPAPVAAADEFARLITGSPLPAIKAPKDHRNTTRILELFEGAGMGAQHDGVRGTAWGLLNAVTQFVDHEAARNPDARMNSAHFGKGADLKDATFAALLAL